MNFDIPAWRTKLQAVSPAPADHASRSHVASAHRSATCLYILQALPATRSHSPVGRDELVSDIVSHLSHIDERNPHFKATAWPAFVAGAETQDDNTRQWLMRRLLAAWEVCPWGYIFTAVDMLQRMWRVQGSEAQGQGEEEEDAVVGGRVSGLRQLWAMETDVLVV
jgi:hypothetical protein